MLTNHQHLHTLLRKTNPTRKEREEILKIIRNGRYDLPECVLENSFKLLKESSSSQQRFHWAKDLIMSGLELNIGSKVKGYLARLRKALGDVPSVAKLSALIDFVSSTEPTDDTFGPLIVEDRTNYDSKKQSLTVMKVNYEWQDYVASLNKYLEQNPNDSQAWMQLGDIYADKSQYLRATFCYQQVIILLPENDYYYIRLAELYYTDGGKANIATAIKYYSYVVSRNPENSRALWGLWRSLNLYKDNLEEQDRQLFEVLDHLFRKQDRVLERCIVKKIQISRYIQLCDHICYRRAKYTIKYPNIIAFINKI